MAICLEYRYCYLLYCMTLRYLYVRRPIKHIYIIIREMKTIFIFFTRGTFIPPGLDIKECHGIKYGGNWSDSAEETKESQNRTDLKRLIIVENL